MAETNGTGTGGKSFQDRELAGQVRALGLKQLHRVLKVIDKKMEPIDIDLEGVVTDRISCHLDDFESRVLEKLSGTLLPRLTEVTGKDGEDLFPHPIFNGASTK